MVLGVWDWDGAAHHSHRVTPPLAPEIHDYRPAEKLFTVTPDLVSAAIVGSLITVHTVSLDDLDGFGVNGFEILMLWRFC